MYAAASNVRHDERYAACSRKREIASTNRSREETHSAPAVRLFVARTATMSPFIRTAAIRRRRRRRPLRQTPRLAAKIRQVCRRHRLDAATPPDARRPFAVTPTLRLNACSVICGTLYRRIYATPRKRQAPSRPRARRMPPRCRAAVQRVTRHIQETGRVWQRC